MAEIVPVTSEALEAQIRNLLPSQRGFGEDLQASNVITPIIDLTPTAEGSSLSDYLQRSLNFGLSTFQVTNTTTLLTSTPGFYDVAVSVGGTAGTVRVELNDNAGTGKNLYLYSTSQITDLPNFFTVFVPVGYILNGISSAATIFIDIRLQQVADVNGNLQQPFGFDPQ